MTHLSRTNKLTMIVTSGLVSLSLLGFTRAQTRNSRPVEEPTSFHDYRGVEIGWLAQDVRKKLGAPANKSDEQELYTFGEKEMAQIVYDKTTQKVITISVDFMAGASEVPTAQQVFGADIESKPDGSKYKIVRYAKAGYWLSYNRTAGDSPVISVTLQKMAQ